MFSSDKKPGGMSNWFFSLRRQPKKQKSLDSSKLLQKSCVDLSNAGVSEQDLLFRTTKPSKLKLTNNSSNNNNNDDGLSSNSNSCTNCCCKFSSKTSSPSFGVSPMDDIEQCDQMRRVLITSEENHYTGIECDQDDDYDDVETSDRLRQRQQLQQNTSKSTLNNFSTNILLYNKKEEFSRTTRTVTTRVVTKAAINGIDSTTPPSSTVSSNSSNGRYNNTNLHHRIGLVFNENGQLINRRQLMNAKNRDGLIFDECGRLLYTDTDETSSSLTPSISILDDSNIEFIDSSTQNSDIQNRANMQHNKCCCNGSKMTLSSSIVSSCKSDWDCNNKQVKILSTFSFTTELYLQIGAIQFSLSDN